MVAQASMVKARWMSVHGPRPASPRRRGVADRQAPCQWQAEVLPGQPPDRYAAQDAGSLDQGSPGLRADAPADEGRAGARPLRGPVESGALDGVVGTTTGCCASW